ncbi:MAG: ATP-binding cassette domain-containing protein [Verrucomicrobia bacterium]|nr:ATP-binding cassette domain-containing protein [Verrucomicrobiota bacterium]MBV9300328.1 ATP-binding cassette domain-containing protein [Verrucomicrobiota bacterium]MBV9642029.1 ATP-binding cassette domain-containing protein [Verrucomicrobiota bacterium]
MAIDPLRTRNLSAERANENGPAEIISNFTYRFRAGLFYHLSGSDLGGKRLLLQILGLLLPPDSGEVIVDGCAVTDLGVDDLGEIRNRKYGFLFSSPFLLPAFTVLENVAMPLFKIAQVEAYEAKVITEEILDLVGVSRIATTSVGQLDELDETLAALARAVVHHPRVLIAELVGSKMRDREAELLLSTLRVSAQRLGLAVIATLAPHLSWRQADVRLEIGPEGVKEFFEGDPLG